ncbi:MAG: nucleotidyl transferase AbiEii/AbiGii toxin family protein [Candidatus Hydrogenedentota bacterium]
MAKKETIATIFGKIVKYLIKNDYSYALCGGLAVSAVVRPRATIDIDFLILLTSQNKKKISKFLKHTFKNKIFIHQKLMNFGIIKFWRSVVLVKPTEVVIDFIIADNPIFEKMIHRAISFNINKIKVRVITPEDLIILKSLSARPHDIEDIKNIKKKYHNTLDKTYIKKCLHYFSQQTTV